MKRLFLLTALFFSVNGMTNQDEQMLEAVKDSNIEKVEQLLQAGISPNISENGWGWTPLYAATYQAGYCCRSAQIVKLLLNAKANPNVANSQGETPLHRAAYNGDTETMQLLLQAGADPNRMSKNQGTPLRAAAHAHSAKNIKLLLQAGADPNRADGGGWTPLFSAVTRGSTKIVRLLLQAGAHANTVSTEGDMLLHEAASASKSNAKMIHLLLKLGANINAINGRGFTPLTQAIVANRLKSVKLLLEEGANPNLAGSYLNPPLLLAIVNYYDQTDTVKLLLQAGANPNALSSEGCTSLEVALSRSHVETVKLLQEYSQLVEDADTNPTQEILNKAVDLGYLGLVKKLVPKLHLTSNEISSYNQSLQKLYAKNKDWIYRAIGKELREYAVHCAQLQKLLTDATPLEELTLQEYIRQSCLLYYLPFLKRILKEKTAVNPVLSKDNAAIIARYALQ